MRCGHFGHLDGLVYNFGLGLLVELNLTSGDDMSV